MTVLEQLLGEKLIAIIRGIPVEKMEQTARALLAGGIGCLEVTFDHTSPQGWENTLQSLACLTGIPEILPGAGTVLTVEEVEAACRAGAKYIISPDTVPEVIARTKALDMVSIPGAMTPTEVTLAHRSGADIVKLFPAGTLGAEYCKALRGPLPHIPCAAVGGVDAENLGQFYRAGIRCFGIGGSLVRPADVKAGRFETVTAGATALRAALTQAEREI